jgi:hypothetical protein
MNENGSKQISGKIPGGDCCCNPQCVNPINGTHDHFPQRGILEVAQIRYSVIYVVGLPIA